MKPQLEPVLLFQEIVFCILLFLIPFSIAAVEICFGLLLLGWILHGWVSGWKDLRLWASPDRFHLRLSLIIFLTVCAMSIAVSAYKAISLSGFINKWLEYALLMVFAVELGRRPRLRNWSVPVIAASGSCVVIEAVTQEMFGYGLFTRHPLMKFSRMTGPYTNPTDLATYLMVLMFILLGYLVVSKRPRWSGAIVLVLFAALACFIRTQTRGAWLGVAAGFVAMITASVHPRIRRAVAAIFVLLLAAIGTVIWLQGPERLHHLFFDLDIGKTDRYYMWRSALWMIKDRPLLGQGLNTFMANYVAYWVGGEIAPRYAHNCFLQVAAETGLIGLTAFLWFLGSVIVRQVQALRRLVSDESALLCGIFGALAGFLVQSAVDTNFYVIRQAALFWVLAGFGFGFAEQLQKLPGAAPAALCNQRL